VRELSIVIPTFNSSKTIVSCLDSILNQTTPCKELVVVDKFSSDGTAERAEGKGAIVIQSSASRSAARNLGVAHCSAFGVLFVDSDMTLSETLIGDCIDGLETHHALVVPEVSIGQGFWAECKALDKRLSLDNELREAPRCFRRTTFFSVGGYTEALEAGEDWDLTNRLRFRALGIGRTRSSMSHNEGNLRIVPALQKKYAYGRTFGRYLRYHPHSAFKQVNPVSRIFLPSLRVMRQDPSHGAGLFVLKSLEFCAAGIGQLRSTNHSSTQSNL
jgi:glycosyltransferase involved in cell wall biosynthesis